MLPFEPGSPLSPPAASAPTMALIREHQNQRPSALKAGDWSGIRFKDGFIDDHDYDYGTERSTPPRFPRGGHPWLPKKNGAGRGNWGHWRDLCKDSTGDGFVAAVDENDLNYISEKDNEAYDGEDDGALGGKDVRNKASLSLTSWEEGHAAASWRAPAAASSPTADEAWEEGGRSYGTRNSDVYLS